LAAARVAHRLAETSGPGTCLAGGVWGASPTDTERIGGPGASAPGGVQGLAPGGGLEAEPPEPDLQVNLLSFPKLWFLVNPGERREPEASGGSGTPPRKMCAIMRSPPLGFVANPGSGAK